MILESINKDNSDIELSEFSDISDKLINND